MTNEPESSRLVPTCVRCRAALPADSNFCVGCGYQNDQVGLATKQLKIENSIDERLEESRTYYQRIAFWLWMWIRGR